MDCPVCGEKLREIERYGVEVDICPACKGVWLDRGELEKILEIADTGGPTEARDDRRRLDDRYRDDEYQKGKRQEVYPQRRKKRGGWLGDLLEGFGED